MIPLVNFASLLEDVEGLHDVEFEVDDGSEEKKPRIKAHKLLLAFVSPVFRSQFFGWLATKPHNGTSGNETGDGAKVEVVVVKDTSYTAFNTMIQVLYSGEKQAVLDITDLCHLFQLYSLTEKYFLKDLGAAVDEAIGLVKLSHTDYVTVLSVIDEYKDLINFGKICGNLKSRFLTIVQAELSKPADIYLFWSEIPADDRELFDDLIRMMADRIKLECKRCGKLKEECKNGEGLTWTTAAIGQKVMAQQDITMNGRAIRANTCGKVNSLSLTNKSITITWELSPMNTGFYQQSAQVQQSTVTGGPILGLIQIICQGKKK